MYVKDVDNINFLWEYLNLSGICNSDIENSRTFIQIYNLLLTILVQ